MRVFIFLLAVLVPMMATAAERSDSPETRLRLVEIELERLRTETKDNAKDEADKVREKFADKIDNLEKAQERAKGSTDQWLTVLGIMIGVSTLIFALAGLWGAWKTGLIAKAEARDALRGMLEEADTAKAKLAEANAEIEALLKDVRQGHGEAMSKVAEIMAAGIAPEDYTPPDQQQVATKQESPCSEMDHCAMAQQAILAGDSGKAADHLADADESKPLTWMLRAQVKLSQGDWAGARQDGETMLRLSREQHSCKDEATALEILEKVYRSSADFPGAEDGSKQALQIMRELVADDQGDPPRRLNLAVSLWRRAQICLQMKSVTEAEDCASEAVEICRALHADNPGGTETLDQLARSCLVLGTIYLAKGEWTVAKPVLTETMRIRQGLRDREQCNTEWLRQLALCWNRLGMLARGQQDWALACVYAAEYRGSSEHLASRDPHNVEWQVDVAFAWRDEADCERQLGGLTVAKSRYQAAIKRLEELDGQRKLSTHARALLEECRRKSGEVETLMTP